MTTTGLVLTDFDGTMPPADQCNPLIASLERAGIRIAVVTARPMPSILRVLHQRGYRITRPIVAAELGGAVFEGYSPLHYFEVDHVELDTAASLAARFGACRLTDWNQEHAYTRAVMMPSDEKQREEITAAIGRIQYVAESSGATSVLHPVGLDKGATARWIREWLGNPPAIALGDSELDMPMVRAVGGMSMILSGPEVWCRVVESWAQGLGVNGEPA